MLGDLLWVSDLLAGGELLPTSIFTHGGGLVLGLIGVRQLGWSRYSYVKALLAFAALQQLTRLLTPRDANVNMAFSLPDGWRWLYPSYGVFLAANYGLAVAVFCAVHWLATRAVASGRRG